MVKQNYFEKLFIHIISYYVSIFVILIYAIWKPIKFICLCYYQFIIQPPKRYFTHEEQVNKIQEQIKDWNTNGRKTKMCTGRPSWMGICQRTPIYKDTLTRINFDMNNVIYIRTDIPSMKNVVCVEPLMTIGKLTSELGKHGWTLPVVPELDELTIGGLVCGAGIETSSHKYGLFHNICVSYEFVISNGDIVKCSEKKNSDLFYAIPGSHGTLGFLTAIELEIIPAKTHVKLEYIPVYSLDEAIATFQQQTNQKYGNDFVEGIMFSLNEGVIMVGEMTSEPIHGMINKIGKWYKPWFYKHVETFHKKNHIINNKKLIEYIPLRDYYHRHTKALFWINQNTIPYGNNIIFRYLFGWVLPPKIDMIKRFVPIKIINLFDINMLIQDIVIPINKLKDALILSHEISKIYPIWLCPAKFKNTPGACDFLNNTDDELYVDVGIYGLSKLKNFDTIKSTRKLELFCLKNRGYQALYADIYMTREEFRKMFKEELYMKMRKELNCEDAFPEVYEKVCRAARR